MMLTKKIYSLAVNVNRLNVCLALRKVENSTFLNKNFKIFSTFSDKKDLKSEVT
jgi:hypothetical protein